MKLISCHIDKFGKLSDFDVKFNDGITSFCEDNGYGKTTIAVFIKAMFYSLPKASSAKGSFDERTHFCPIGEKRFGGYIIFEKGGDIYRIKRIFDKNKVSEDETVIFKNNREYFSENIGLEIFGIGAESFSKILFFTPEKLGGYSDLTDVGAYLKDGEINDSESYKKALSSLTDARKRYRPDKGDNGLIGALNREILDLMKELERLEETEKNLPSTYERYKKALSEKKDVERRNKEEKERIGLIELWSRYDEKQAEIYKIKNAAEYIQQKYLKGIPSKEDTDKLSDIEKEYIEYSARQKSLTKYDEAECRRLSAVFKTIPDEETLDAVREDVSNLVKKKKDFQALEYSSVSEEEEALIELFSPFPSDETEKKLKENIDRFSLLDDELKKSRAEIKPKKIFLPMIFLVLSVIVMAAGAATVFFNTVAGIILSAAGFVSGSISLVSTIKNSSKEKSDEYEKIIEDLSDCEENINSELSKYCYCDGNVYTRYARFVSDLERAKRAYEKKEEKEREKRAFEEEIRREEEGINEFFLEYGISGSVEECMRELEEEISDFKDLLREKEEYEKSFSDIETRMSKLAEAEKSILEKYDLTSKDVIAWEMNSERLIRLNADLKEKIKERDLFAKNNNLLERPPESEIVSQSEYDEKIKNFMQIESVIRDMESDVSRISSVKNELAEKNALKAEYKRRAEDLDAAVEFIRRAESNLKENCVSGVKERYREYLKKADKVLSEKAHINDDYTPVVDINGEIKDDRYLSDGLKTVNDLCYRLAFIGNMYKDEKAFLILDDPFSALDEKHLTEVKKMLVELCSEQQMIYFTCHDSRMI